MHPPMKGEAILLVTDKTQPPDRYGKYPVKEMKYKARVRFATKIIIIPGGVNRQSKLEIDLPAIANLENGMQIKALDNFGVWHTAEIIDISDATNFAGNRILYRTVLCA